MELLFILENILFGEHIVVHLENILFIWRTFPVSRSTSFGLHVVFITKAILILIKNIQNKNSFKVQNTSDLPGLLNLLNICCHCKIIWLNACSRLGSHCSNSKVCVGGSICTERQRQCAVSEVVNLNQKVPRTHKDQGKSQPLKVIPGLAPCSLLASCHPPLYSFVQHDILLKHGKSTDYGLSPVTP